MATFSIPVFLRLDRQEAPATIDQEQTRTRKRGVFGSTTVSKDDVRPNLGVFGSFQKVLQESQKTRYCNPQLNATHPELDAHLAASQVPPDQQCAATMVYYMNRTVRNQRGGGTGNDLRRVREGTPGYDQLTLPGKAMVHLNRAKQMYSSGVAKLKSQNPLQQRVGRALLANMTPNNPQVHKTNKISACSEVLKAYQLVREHEMNPPAPLTSQGTPNPARIEADHDYQLLMGTTRMVPNRLGIGIHARTVWMSYGIPDPNYFDRTFVDASYDDLTGRRHPHNRVGSTLPHSRLYYSVAEDDEFGPLLAAAWMRWNGLLKTRSSRNVMLWEGLLETTFDDDPTPINMDTVPDIPYLLNGNLYSEEGIHTDYGQCLADIHQHFPPPPVWIHPQSAFSADPTSPILDMSVHGRPVSSFLLRDPHWQGIDIVLGNILTDPDIPLFFPPMSTCVSEAPPRLQYDPFATPGVTNENPRSGQSVFYPQGEAADNNADEPPLRQVDNPTVLPIPVMQQDGSQEPFLSTRWDARSACHYLVSESSRLRRQIASYRRDQGASTLWQGGPSIETVLS